MRNAEIADALSELGTLYELDGAVRYRVIAYQRGGAGDPPEPGLGRGAGDRRAGRPSCRGSARRCRRRSSPWSRPARSRRRRS